MEEFEKKICLFISEQGVPAQHFVFGHSCHSVKEAAAAAGTVPENLVKNVCLIAGGRLVVAIVKGEDKVSLNKVELVTGCSGVRTASPEEILSLSGFPVGGVPSFGFQADFLVDKRVMEKEVVFTGGGSPRSLIKIAPMELLKINGGRLAEIRL